MKGLDYIQVQSNIAFDDDLEHVSDAAFRAFIELIGISAYDLSDGQVSLDRARKLCNCKTLRKTLVSSEYSANDRTFDDILTELSDGQYITVNASFITIRNYSKYQRSREDTLRLREENREYVRIYREKRKDLRKTLLTNESDRKSKSKKNTPCSPPQGTEFDLFWAAYPKRVGKGQARKAWNTAVKKTQPALILEGLDRLLPQLLDKLSTDPQYVKNPSTWLNGECWLDEPSNGKATYRSASDDLPLVGPDFCFD